MADTTKLIVISTPNGKPALTAYENGSPVFGKELTPLEIAVLIEALAKQLRSHI